MNMLVFRAWLTELPLAHLVRTVEMTAAELDARQLHKLGDRAAQLAREMREHLNRATAPPR